MQFLRDMYPDTTWVIRRPASREVVGPMSDEYSIHTNFQRESDDPRAAAEYKHRIARLHDPEPLVDAEVIAAHLAIPRKTVLQYARDGRLPCVRIGRHVRFRLSDIDEYVRGV